MVRSSLKPQSDSWWLVTRAYTLDSPSGSAKKGSTMIRLGVGIIAGAVVGIMIGISFSRVFSESLWQLGIPARGISKEFLSQVPCEQNLTQEVKPKAVLKPRGAETLPAAIITASTDLYLRRLYGRPEEDVPVKPKYLIAFTVGISQKENIDRCLSKFTSEWMVMLFHYDGHMDGWDEFEWSHRAIHIGVKKQAKWWYAKRFLQPDVVDAYEYIFIWDEDLDLQHFDAQIYIDIVKRHGLDISQPAIDQSKGMTWKMTGRRGDVEVHKSTEEKPGWCESPQVPPCAAYELSLSEPHEYVESVKLEKLVANGIVVNPAGKMKLHLLGSVLLMQFNNLSVQNDLVHGWGLDFNLRRCVEPAHEKIGVVDAQWIIHMGVPTLGGQGRAMNGKQAWEGVRARCELEWGMFSDRVRKAEAAEAGTAG